MEREITSEYIQEEMRAASAGSFPLSPGIMQGHHITAHLYWHYRRGILTPHSVVSLFGTSSPALPELANPRGHRVVNVEGLNRTVWDYFLKICFTERPNINPQDELRKLITANAESDIINFYPRLRGEKSQIINDGQPAPSLVRASVFEGRFPKKYDFFTWLFAEMGKEIRAAADQGFDEPWSNRLETLIETWNNEYPFDSFIPRR